MDKHKMKILLLCPQARPNGTGEEYCGFMLAKGISEKFDTTIITLTPDNFEGTLADHLPFARVFERTKWPLHKISERFNAIVKPNYLNFHRFASKIISDTLKDEKFDVAHQFGPLGMRYPSPLANFSIPYVLGPFGGGISTPAGFQEDEQVLPWYYSLRSFDNLRLRYDPILRRSFERAEVAVGMCEYVEKNLESIKIKNFQVQLEIGIDATHSPQNRDTKTGKFKLLYVGRVIRTKGLVYAIKALGKIKDLPNWHLDIIGDGDDFAFCQAVADELGIANQITFHGYLPRPEINKFYSNSDLFLFPSFREPSGGVILEAMSFGLPMIVANYGGPATIATTDFAIKVSTSSPDRMVQEIALAIKDLITDRAKLTMMSDAALKNADQKHLWKKRYAFYEELYRGIYSKHNS